MALKLREQQSENISIVRPLRTEPLSHTVEKPARLQSEKCGSLRRLLVAFNTWTHLAVLLIKILAYSLFLSSLFIREI
jgi:hypothetical protein